MKPKFNEFNADEKMLTAPPYFDHTMSSKHPTSQLELTWGDTSMVVAPLVLGPPALKRLANEGEGDKARALTIAVYMAARECERRMLFGTDKQADEIEEQISLGELIAVVAPEKLIEASERVVKAGFEDLE